VIGLTAVPPGSILDSQKGGKHPVISQNQPRDQILMIMLAPTRMRLCCCRCCTMRVCL
jgi:hypothetical protein